MNINRNAQFERLELFTKPLLPLLKHPHGGELNEIDSCISHRHGKSNMAGPTSVNQVIHASLKYVDFFNYKAVMDQNDFKCFG